MTDLTLVMPFNCTAQMMEERIASVGGDVACVLLEPIMMNCGIILARDSFLQDMRQVCNKHGILLVSASITLPPVC